MAFYTDLALEAYESFEQENTKLDGVSKETLTLHGFEVTKIMISSKEASKKLQKPIGTYITMSIDDLTDRTGENFSNAAHALSEIISEILGQGNDDVLVAGLGNRFITPDAIGPKSAEKVLVTRHLVETVPQHFGSYRKVSAIIPGVLSMTGVSSADIVSGVIKKSQAKTLIAIDALAARRLTRLLRTIQISNTGITPGAGVGNSQNPLTEKYLKIPVISIGIPTVVDGKSLYHDIKEQSECENSEALDDLKTPVIVTTKDIDSEIQSLSKIIGYGINKALNPHLTIEDLDMLLS